MNYNPSNQKEQKRIGEKEGNRRIVARTDQNGKRRMLDCRRVHQVSHDIE